MTFGLNAILLSRFRLFGLMTNQPLPGYLVPNPFYIYILIYIYIYIYIYTIYILSDIIVGNFIF